MPPVTVSRRRFKSPYWDVPPVGYEHVTPKEYKAMQASGQVPHSVVNPSSQILQGTKYAHPDPLEAAKAAAAIITATILGNQNKTNSTPVNRQARRLYVGNIPLIISENELIEFFQSNMVSTENTGGPPVIGCQINVDKNFAFVEFRTTEDTTNAMALDGITFKSQTLKIRRPHDYQQTGSGGPGQGSRGPPNSGNPMARLDRPTGGLNLATSSLLNAQSSANQPGLGSSSSSTNQALVQIQVPGMQGIQPNSAPRVLTEVLCLMNMVVPEELIDDEEYQDILEDIRDECSKYGAVKSIVIPRPIKEETRRSITKQSGGDDYGDDADDDNNDRDDPDAMNMSDDDNPNQQDDNNDNDNNNRTRHNGKGGNSNGRYEQQLQQQTVPGLGKVFVEFDSATEAQRAQINLAGRRFAGRVVVTSYFARDRYRNKEF